METNSLTSKADLNLFFQETWARLKSKSPKFFRVIGYISMAMAAIGFIPDAMTWLGITLPEKWMPIVGKMMIAAGAWGKIMASLSVSKPAIEIMPFTEKKQIEQEIKADQIITNAIK